MACPVVDDHCRCADVLSAGRGRWLYVGPWHRYECSLYGERNDAGPVFVEPASR